jgi:hypothetical protein
MTTSLRPSSWPPGALGRWLGVGLVSLATLGGAGGGLASLAGAMRGDDRRQVAERLDTMSGRLAAVESAQRKSAEDLAYIRGRLEPIANLRAKIVEASSHLAREPEPDVRQAREALAP